MTLDFGASFPGADRWLEIAVRTNGGGTFSTLSPRQQITPTPYAITAGSATTATTATNATTASTATTANNFSGVLAGNVTGPQGATVVDTVGCQTAANVASGVIAANAATSANTASTIVKRDASGNFTAGSLTLSGTNVASDFRIVNGANTQSVVSSSETDGLRVVRASVYGNGTIYSGTGFSVVTNNAGSYTVTFATPFSDPPSVVCQVACSSVGSATSSLVTPNNFKVYVWIGSTLVNKDFSFIAIGKR